VPYRALRSLLFGLPPELAHRIAILALSALDRVLPEGEPRAGELPVTVAGITFPNPVGLAAGFDKDGDVTRVMAALGFGFVEVGTVTPLPQPGNARPRLFRLPEEEALINRLGFNSAGAARVAAHLARRTRRIPVGLNVGPNRDTPPDQVVGALLSALRLAGPRADYLVVNLSSPNTPGLRDLLGEGPLGRTLEGLQVGLAKEGLGKPLFLKVSPDMTGEALDRVAATAIDCGVAGLIATNTTVGREGVGARWRHETGGLSGRPLCALATQVLARLNRAAGGRLSLIGAGGVASAEDAYARIRAGASLVQLYTGLVYEGPALPQRIVRGLAERLERDGFRCIADAARGESAVARSGPLDRRDPRS
jgi:dihydroorotate dehydrogenase